MIHNDSILIESQPFPLIIWTKYLFSKRHIILLSCESYYKMTFRNRFVLSGSNGLIHLSIPLIHGRDQKIPFKDVQICYGEKWQLIHWRTITSCYNKAPWFEYYRDGLEKFFINRYEFLFDWNLAIMDWLKQVLKFPAELEVAIQIPGAHIEDVRNKWLPKNFQQADLGFQYSQVFKEKTGFQNNLSVLDLLLNTGPETKTLLTESSSQ